MSEYHNPVLLTESIDALVQNPSGKYADATFGGGSHSREILSRLDSEGRLLSFDRDEEALANAPDDSRLLLVHNNFRFIHNYTLYYAEELSGNGTTLPQAIDAGQSRSQATGQDASQSRSQKDASHEAADQAAAGQRRSQETADGAAGQRRSHEAASQSRSQNSSQSRDQEAASQEAEADGALLDGVLADLGVSSHQFDTASRGFSFRYDAPLDMRMNAQGGKTAADIVNSYTQEELERILRLYGEVDSARKLSKLIVLAREKAPILTTTDLQKAIQSALPAFASHKELAKIYQAFRIEVNDEMRSLQKFLEGATRSLKKGGRLVIITYHSLEDRMVKNFIKSGNIDGIIVKDNFGRDLSPLRAVVRKPILPSEQEISGNTRARSAKLRVAEKI